ncbi:MAG: pyridoxal phosphate-dependent aminotransferase [Candidatus Nitronauta litoralis]|uniref:Aminotransferase n=1 Tax=Candidatus Nitronauta litoralis TaxID=2705533 RepID=A0A7T0BUW6_9BACT|nr:MAG: pyridoxal phosphate-dependent aminotransferase [Candidatus Nitronauta litoralis]
MKLSERIKNLKPSMTLAITAKAKALRAEGLDVIGLGAGEPDFDTPEFIKQAAIDSIKQNDTHYTPVGGTDAIKDAIIKKLERDNGVSYARDNIVVSCGAKHSLYNLAQALWETGDEVILQSPYWVSYPEIIRLAGATPVIIDTDADSEFKMSPTQLEAAITPNTRALILNSPSNPTGLGYTRQELETLSQIALDKDVTVISDEIYDKIVFDGFEPACPASFSEELKKNTIVVNGASKAYAMTGWRIGYIACEPEIATGVTKLQGQSTSNPCSIAQAAAAAAFVGDDVDVARMCDEFKNRRDYLLERFEKMPGVSCPKPIGTFYSFPDISGSFGKTWNGKTIEGSLDFCEFLLETEKVAVVPGIAFGADKHVRLSFAASLDVLKEASDRIERALKSLT